MSRPSGRAAIAVATALLLTLVACGDGSDDAISTGSDSSTTAPGEQPDTEGPETPADEATGFYLPGELPDGWTIRFEQITNPWQQLCPCETEEWRGPGGQSSSSTARAGPRPVVRCW